MARLKNLFSIDTHVLASRIKNLRPLWTLQTLVEGCPRKNKIYFGKNNNYNNETHTHIHKKETKV